MKNVIKLIASFVLGCALLVSCAPITDNVMKKCEKEKFLYLVAGFDDAAENTDVLFTLGYDRESDTLKISQIPRDTYVYFGGSQNKINQYYACAVNSGKSRERAMSETAEFIASLFGTSFDGYIGLGTAAFRKTVDAVGGVDVEIANDMLIDIDGEDALFLKKGINHLSGSDAEKFIRYRKGYAMGDLARLDAQKLFLSSLLTKLSADFTLPTLVRIAGILQNEAISNVKLNSFTSMIMDAAVGGVGVEFVTVPGEPAIGKSGLSFYVLNRKAAESIARSFMFADKDFDPEKRFLDSSELSFANIYGDEDFPMP